jgi:hypothetical protein
MPAARCLWCIDPPFDEIAVAKWHPSTPDDRERLTIPLCRKHLERLRKSGDKGRDIKGFMYKEGWW